MKKTLITLMALAGVAVAEDWAATFTTSDQSNAQTHTDYSAVFEPSSPLALAFDNLVITGDKKNGSYSTNAPGNATPTAIRPNANICAESSNDDYTLTFTLSNSGEETIVISGITLSAFGYNSKGNAHSEGGTPHANFDLQFTLPENTDAITLRSTNVLVYSSATVAFDMGSNVITLKNNESVEFSLKVYKQDGKGSFVGLKGATFSGHVVPEPATVTLSLLALAGLAARRRRR